MHKDDNDSRIEKRHTEENYIKQQLENEVSLFRSLLIKEKMLQYDCISTKRFWLKYKSVLPNLFKLALKLLNIHASTAFIERFFSICGIICSEKNSNMDTLNELTIENDDDLY